LPAYLYFLNRTKQQFLHAAKIDLSKQNQSADVKKYKRSAILWCFQHVWNITVNYARWVNFSRFKNLSDRRLNDSSDLCFISSIMLESDVINVESSLTCDSSISRILSHQLESSRDSHWSNTQIVLSDSKNDRRAWIELRKNTSRTFEITVWIVDCSIERWTIKVFESSVKNSITKSTSCEAGIVISDELWRRWHWVAKRIIADSILSSI